MANIFTWIPSKSFSKSSKPRVLTAQFGDGYSQRVADGINTLVRSWTLEFRSISLSKASEIIAHLEAHKGVTAFLWTPPGDTTQYRVVCSEWTETYDSHISRTLSMVFNQVFDPL